MSTKPLIRRIEQVAYHRNGVSGLGFHAIIFIARGPAIDSLSDERFLASVFKAKGAVSVISLDRTENNGVTFGDNSWRGDDFEPELRAAVAAYEASDER